MLIKVMRPLLYNWRDLVEALEAVVIAGTVSHFYRLPRSEQSKW